jgi:hypothetical protein
MELASMTLFQQITVRFVFALIRELNEGALLSTTMDTWTEDIFRSIKSYIGAQTAFEYGDYQMVHCGFGELVRNELHESGNLAVELLTAGLKYVNESGQVVEDAGQIDPTSDITRRNIVAFYENITDLFTYRSTLLGSFWLPGEEDEAYLPEHIIRQDFEQYEDDDWFTRELDLVVDFQDVLLGPAQLTLDDVSTNTAVTLDSFCGLCQNHGGEIASMRKIIVCGHECCEECLDKQIKAKHECRFRCSICRAELI